jgi:hypothetical protein
MWKEAVRLKDDQPLSTDFNIYSKLITATSKIDRDDMSFARGHFDFVYIGTHR